MLKGNDHLVFIKTKIFCIEKKNLPIKMYVCVILIVSSIKPIQHENGKSETFH